jgi:hypothetical protein
MNTTSLCWPQLTLRKIALRPDALPLRSSHTSPNLNCLSSSGSSRSILYGLTQSLQRVAVSSGSAAPYRDSLSGMQTANGSSCVATVSSDSTPSSSMVSSTSTLLTSDAASPRLLFGPRSLSDSDIRKMTLSTGLGLGLQLPEFRMDVAFSGSQADATAFTQAKHFSSSANSSLAKSVSRHRRARTEASAFSPFLTAREPCAPSSLLADPASIVIKFSIIGTEDIWRIRVKPDVTLDGLLALVQSKLGYPVVLPASQSFCGGGTSGVNWSTSSVDDDSLKAMTKQDFAVWIEKRLELGPRHKLLVMRHVL